MIFIYLGMLKIKKVLLNPLFETKFGVYFIRSKVLCLLPSISLDGRLFVISLRNLRFLLCHENICFSLLYNSKFGLLTINQQPESCVISIIYSTFAYKIRQRYF